MKRRLYFLVLMAAVGGWASGGLTATAGTISECVNLNAKTVPVKGCATASSWDPLIAGVEGESPLGAFEVRLGFARGTANGLCDSDPTHKGILPPVPPLTLPWHDLPQLPDLPVLPLPPQLIEIPSCATMGTAPYEIVAVTQSPEGELGIRGYGTPVPCTGPCEYDLILEANRLSQSIVVCYNANAPKIGC